MPQQKLKVRNVSEVGLVLDVQPLELPPNAWTELSDVVPTDRGLSFANGWQSAKAVDGTVIRTDQVCSWSYNFVQHSASHWVLGGRNVLYEFDGNGLTNILPPDIVTANQNTLWNGDNLSDILVVTNGIVEPTRDPPVQWDGTGQAQRLANWPVNAACALIVPFKNHLVGADISDDTGRFPHMVWWSHPADPGTVPVSWDYTDPTRDAGRVTLGDSGGRITAMKVLGDALVIYKTDGIWEMRYVGGQSIFQFRQLFSTSGAIGPYAVAIARDQHVFLTDEDIVIFDGARPPQSIGEDRVKKALFAELDENNARRSWVAVDENTKQVWFAPQTPWDPSPVLAWVWSWENDTWHQRTMPGIVHASSGRYYNMVTDTENLAWGDETDLEWGSETLKPWGGLSENWLDDAMLGVDETNRIIWLGKGNRHSFWLGEPVGEAELAFNAYAGRDNIALSDDDVVSMATEVFPRLRESSNTTIQLAATNDINTSSGLESAPSKAYNSAAGPKVSLRATGRYHGIRFTFSSEPDYPQFELLGYDINFTPLGGR